MCNGGWRNVASIAAGCINYRMSAYRVTSGMAAAAAIISAYVMVSQHVASRRRNGIQPAKLIMSRRMSLQRIVTCQLSRSSYVNGSLNVLSIHQ